jgi:hypothetical protein
MCEEGCGEEKSGEDSGEEMSGEDSGEEKSGEERTLPYTTHITLCENRSTHLYALYPGNQHSRSSFFVAALFSAPDTMLITW